MPQYIDSPAFKHVMRLTDVDTKQVFYDKLTYIYLEMPKFNKDVDSLNGYAESWLYVIKNLEQLAEKPKKLQDRVFEHFFRAAEIANFKPEQRLAYEASLKNMRDYMNTINSAEERGVMKGLEQGFEIGREEGRIKGREEGREEGRVEAAKDIAKGLKRLGLSDCEISKATGLSESEISRL